MDSRGNKYRRNSKISNNNINHKALEASKAYRTIGESTVCTQNITISRTNLQQDNDYTIRVGLPDKVDEVNIGDCNMEDINDIIKANASTRRSLSRTCADSCYVPLSKGDKLKFIQEQNTTSDQRLQLYSNLFKEIKSHMSNLSNNISAPYVETTADASKLGLPFTKKVSVSDMDNLMIYPQEMNTGTISAKNRLSANNKKTKIIVKISNPVLERTETGITVDLDGRDLDEEIGAIMIPYRYYHNNTLRDLDLALSRKCYSNLPSPRKISEACHKKYYSEDFSNELTGPGYYKIYDSTNSTNYHETSADVMRLSIFREHRGSKFSASKFTNCNTEKGKSPNLDSNPNQSDSYRQNITTGVTNREKSNKECIIL